MDKFLLKSKRNQKPVNTDVEKAVFRQATIESLKGVVVIEDIERLKNKLKLKNQSKEVMIESIQELGRKQPPNHILLTTKIGKVINKLRKNEDKDVAEAASIVYRSWRYHIESHQFKPLIEVKCDQKSEKMRNSGRKFLADALKVPVKVLEFSGSRYKVTEPYGNSNFHLILMEHDRILILALKSAYKFYLKIDLMNDRLAEAIERECFHESKRLLTAHYKRTMRNIVFKLKHQETVRNSVISGDLSVEQLVQTNKK